MFWPGSRVGLLVVARARARVHLDGRVACAWPLRRRIAYYMDLLFVVFKLLGMNTSAWARAFFVTYRLLGPSWSRRAC